MRRGYIYNGLEKESINSQTVAMMETSDEWKDSSHLSNKRTIQLVLRGMEPSDELIIYDYQSLAMTIAQYGNLLRELNRLGISLKFLNETKAKAKLLADLASYEKTLISQRTTQGLIRAKERGAVGGRPKIPLSIQKEIFVLYHKNRYTLREISIKLNISLGTCYKYSQMSITS